jgi:hypothetical protein
MIVKIKEFVNELGQENKLRYFKLENREYGGHDFNLELAGTYATLQFTALTRTQAEAARDVLNELLDEH